MSGPFFREWRARLRPSAVRLEQAAEARTILAWQASLNWQESQSVVILINSLANTPNAVVRVGSMLVVKKNGDIYSNQLTLEQVHKLEHNPELVQDPEGILSALGISSTEPNISSRTLRLAQPADSLKVPESLTEKIDDGRNPL